MKILEENKSIEKFKNLSSKVEEILNSIELNVDEKIIKEEWNKNRLNFRNRLKSSFDYSFLKNKDIAGLMFQSDMNLAMKELDFLNKNLLNKIVEYNFSNPNLDIGNKMMSTNTIHHIYHISRYLNYKKQKPEIKSALEWGGGYGNMAKIFFETFDELETYTIIDIPEFIVVQKLYLTSYFGEENVRIVKNVNDIKSGVNLISINDALEMEFKSNDIFISTWALTESSLYCQEFAEKKGFLNYENILVSYHQCGNHIPFMHESSVFDSKIKNIGIHVENVEVIPGINYYGFK